jgi:cell division septation protein DedD
MKQFILILSLLFITSCGASNSGSPSASAVATTAPTPNASGELLATVDFAAGGNISASALQLATNDPLSQFTSVAIPAGALSKNIDVKIFETGSLAIQIAPSEFGVTEIKKAGPALVIQGDSTALKSEITISIPYSSSASLNLADEQFAVLALSGNNLEIFVGDQLTIGSKTIGVKVKNFGAFQVVKYSGVVTQQKVVSERISETSLQSVALPAPAAPAPAPEAPAPAAPAAPAAPTPTPTPTVPSWVNTSWTNICYDFDNPSSSFQTTISITDTKVQHNVVRYNAAGCLDSHKGLTQIDEWIYISENISYEGSPVIKFKLTDGMNITTAYTQEYLTVWLHGTDAVIGQPFTTMAPPPSGDTKLIKIEQNVLTISIWGFANSDVASDGVLRPNLFPSNPDPYFIFHKQ